MASFYDQPDQTLMRHDGTYLTCKHLHNHGIRVIAVKSICSVVMMAPDPHFAAEHDQWFVMEKPGLKVLSMMDWNRQETDEDHV